MTEYRIEREYTTYYVWYVDADSEADALGQLEEADWHDGIDSDGCWADTPTVEEFS
jgi:hypothetical protein